jgi:hypothetical protein
MNLFTYLPPFNTTTLIKPMNKKEEGDALEDSHVTGIVLPERDMLPV